MNPGSDPEIPSLKPLGGKEEDKKSGTNLPSSAKPATPSGFKFPGFGGGSTGASKAFSAPNLKVRGLSGGGSTVMDRLKNLRKKDLIFIGAGLCTLGMAPLAEHLLMSPDEQTAKLQEGFNSQQGPLFQDGSSVYEPGNGVGSPGGLVGQGADVITPLNVRDPSNLIMSPGAQKKADAVVAPPPSAPAPSKGESDWKDVLRDSAKSGAGKAVSQSPKLPKPNVKMAGAIRGLSALGGGGGGTGASLKLDPLSARGVPNTAAGSNALTRSQATPGFRGATTRSNASSGAGEDLRSAGSRQSDIFNRGGGAAAALDAASREAIPTGAGSAGGAGGRPGEGGETKNPGGNSQKDNKSLGESLAFLRQKMEMEKSLDLKWEKKKWNQFGRQKMLEESAIKLGFDMFGKFAEKAVIGPLGDFFAQGIAGAGSVQKWVCADQVIPKSQADAQKCAPFGSSRAGTVNLKCEGGTILKECVLTSSPGSDTGGSVKNPDQDNTTPSTVGGVNRERRTIQQNTTDLATLKKQQGMEQFATSLEAALNYSKAALDDASEALGKATQAIDELNSAGKAGQAILGPQGFPTAWTGTESPAVGAHTQADTDQKALDRLIKTNPVVMASIKSQAEGGVAALVEKAGAIEQKVKKAREDLVSVNATIEKAVGLVGSEPDEKASQAALLQKSAVEKLGLAQRQHKAAGDLIPAMNSGNKDSAGVPLRETAARLEAVDAQLKAVAQSLNTVRGNVKVERDFFAATPAEAPTGQFPKFLASVEAKTIKAGDAPGAIEKTRAEMQSIADDAKKLTATGPAPAGITLETVTAKIGTLKTTVAAVPPVLETFTREMGGVYNSLQTIISGNERLRPSVGGATPVAGR